VKVRENHISKGTQEEHTIQPYLADKWLLSKFARQAYITAAMQERMKIGIPRVRYRSESHDVTYIKANAHAYGGTVGYM
jgi:hypothetical protein